MVASPPEPDGARLGSCSGGGQSSHWFLVTSGGGGRRSPKRQRGRPREPAVAKSEARRAGSVSDRRAGCGNGALPVPARPAPNPTGLGVDSVSASRPVEAHPHAGREGNVGLTPRVRLGRGTRPRRGTPVRGPSSTVRAGPPATIISLNFLLPRLIMTRARPFDSPDGPRCPPCPPTT